MKIQIDGEIRDAAPEEIAQIEQVQADVAAVRAEEEARQQARLALLVRLGLTEDEAKLL